MQKKYYRSKRTKSLYGLVYETQTPNGVPTTTEEFVVLSCYDAKPHVLDSEFVTLPVSQLDKYFELSRNTIIDEFGNAYEVDSNF